MAVEKQPSFAQLLKRCRADAGLTQEELAERAGLSARAISDLERGINRTPFTSTMERLAQALELPAPERSLFEDIARGRAVTRSRIGSPEALIPPLVGRELELEELERHLGCQQRPVLMLAGEPGIGKTRLLQETARRGAILGYTVLQGGCQRRSGQEPYSPVVEALARHIGTLASKDLPAALDGCAWLARWLPEITETIPEPSGTIRGEHERRLIFAAVARFMTNVAGPMGTLLVLDDLQWAGGDVFDLLSALISMDTETSRCIVGAFRKTEVDSQHPLFVALADLSRAHLVRQLDLHPLSPEPAGALLAGLLGRIEQRSPELEQRIMERTGGVPFFLVSYAQSIQANPATSRDDLPWDVTQNLRQRVGALPTPAQELLGVASVIGRTVPHKLLVEASGWSEEAVLAALDSTTRAGLLVEKGPLEHRFSHDVIREVVEADLGAARRGVLHQRVGEALERLSGSAVELAWHFIEGHQPERALSYLLAAGDQAEAVFAHEEAERHYRTALDLMREIEQPSLEALTLEKLGRLQVITGRYDLSLATLEQSLEQYGLAHDPEGERRAGALIGWSHAERGTPRQGLDCLRPLMARLETDDASPGLAQLYVVWARLLWDSGSTSESLVAAERASDLGRALGDADIIVRAGYWRGLALWQMGRLEDESKIWSELAETIGVAGQSEQGGGTLISSVPSLVRLSRGEFLESRPQLEYELQHGRLIGDPALIAWSLSLLGFSALMVAEWVSARAYMEEALVISRSLGSSFHLAPWMDLGLLSLWQGDLAAAARYLHEAAEGAERKGDLFAQRVTAERRARLDLMLGQPDMAIERLLPLLDRYGLEEFQVGVLLSTLARAYLQKGDAVHAETLIVDAVRREASQQNRVNLAHALSVQAEVMMYLTRWKEAERCLQHALALYRSTPAPYHVALMLHDYGVLNAKQGAIEPARAQLTEASEVFARLGARIDLERAESALSTL